MKLPKVFPAEYAAYSFFLLAIPLYKFFDLTLRKPLQFYLTQILVAVDGYVVALAVAFGYLICQHIKQCRTPDGSFSLKELWLDYLERFLNWRAIVTDLRLLNAVMVMFVAYTQWKHLIPHVTMSTYDLEFVTIENAIFGSTGIGGLLHQFIGLEARHVVSTLYTWYFHYLSVIVLFFIILRDEARRQRFLFAFCLLWIVGIFTVYLVPTFGPCFATYELYTFLADTKSGELQGHLWEAKLFLDQYPASEKGIYLISGFPSLHFAVVLLGSYYLWPLSRVLFAISLVCVASTFLATLYLGWHYLLDDIGSVVLVGVVVLICRWCEVRKSIAR